MGSPSGSGGRHKLTEAEHNTFGVANVVGHVMVIAKTARSKLEDEAVGTASVLLKSHKGRRGHIEREREAGRGGSRERGGPRGEGGGAGKMKLTFRINPEAAEGGGRQRERSHRGRPRGRVRREEGIAELTPIGRLLEGNVMHRGGGHMNREGEVGVTDVANHLADRASLGVRVRRDEGITKLRPRGRML